MLLSAVYEYFNDTLCVRGSAVIISNNNQSGLISKDLWDKWVKRGSKLLQKGGNGRVSLMEFETVPPKYQILIKQKFGDPVEGANSSPFQDLLKTDDKAVTFYQEYTLSDGRNLPEPAQREYVVNASTLNVIKTIYINQKAARSARNGSMRFFWKYATSAIEKIQKVNGHTLSANQRILQRQFDKYVNEGYAGLISGKYCNQNRRKVNEDIERLLMSLYTMPNKPFGCEVHEMYTMFLNGKIQPVDQKTGEVFDPENYKKAGYPIEIARSTVWNYLNQPENRAVVDRKRNGQFQYNNMHRPHAHRKAPNYSFSKISMDDRDLPRKINDGKRVKAYYAYDVTSGAIIGYSHSRYKDEELFLDCMQNMFRLINSQGWGMPAEVEVENHLVNKFFDELGDLFPFVRICAPGNSQEKHAEHLNKAKKYGVEKKNHKGIGRWWAKSEAYRVDVGKVNDEFKETTYSYDRLVGDDFEDIKKYNNSLHPNQKKYAGLTRWEVLCNNLNPNLEKPELVRICKSIGEKTETSIRRNQYVTVQHAKYALPTVDVLRRLLPNNYEVDAYYLPDADGTISEVFIYQNGVFLCRCAKMELFNTAQVEQTDEDKEAFKNQQKYISSFDKLTKTRKDDLASIVVIDPHKINEIVETAEVEIVDTILINETEEDREILIPEFDEEYWINAGKNGSLSNDIN